MILEKMIRKILDSLKKETRFGKEDQSFLDKICHEFEAYLSNCHEFETLLFRKKEKVFFFFFFFLVFLEKICHEFETYLSNC